MVRTHLSLSLALLLLLTGSGCLFRSHKVQSRLSNTPLLSATSDDLIHRIRERKRKDGEASRKEAKARAHQQQEEAKRAAREEREAERTATKERDEREERKSTRTIVIVGAVLFALLMAAFAVANYIGDHHGK